MFAADKMFILVVFSLISFVILQLFCWNNLRSLINPDFIKSRVVLFPFAFILPRIKANRESSWI